MANRTKLTPEKKQDWLEAFRRSGVVSKACEALNVSRTSVYELRKNDPDFAEEWEEIFQEYTEKLEAECYRRAFEGTSKPVFFQGVECGSIQEFSDTLAIFLLKGRKPEVYRERTEITGANGGPLQTETVINIIEIPDNGRDRET